MTGTLWVKNFLLNFQEAAHRENGTECPDQSDDGSFEQEWPSDEAVFCAHQTHDFDLRAAGEDGNPDCIGNQEYGNQQ